MKILLINKYHYRYAGAERAYFDLAELLCKDGHEVAFFAMNHTQNVPTRWEKYFVEYVQYEGREYRFREKLRIAARIIWNHEANTKLAALIDEFQPDVAHCFNVYHQLSWSILHVLRRKHVPIVLTLCDFKMISPNYSLFVRGNIWEHCSGWRCLWDRCVKDSLAKSLVCVVEQWVHRFVGTYRLVDVPLALSKAFIDSAVRLGYRADIRLLPQPLVPFPDLTRPLPAADGGYFLYFGRLSHEKGVATLLAAFARYRGAETLNIVGAGPEEERLKNMVEEYQLSGRVHFLGARYAEDLQPLLDHALAVVIPSEWYENNPYVLLETIAAGVLVIAARVGSLPERIREGETGFLFEPGDPEDLAAALTRVVQSTERERLRQAARGTLEDCRPEPFRQKIMAIYEGLRSAKKH